MNFKHYFWCFLDLFVGKLILSIDNEHAQDYSCPGATFAFCSHEKSYFGKAGYPVLYNGKPASQSCPRATKNSCEQDAPEAIISAQLLVKISYVAHLVAQAERYFCCHSNIIFVAINCATEFYWHKK